MKSGIQASCDYAKRAIVQRQFQERLFAEPTTFCDLVLRDREECATRAPALAELPKSFDVVPLLKFTGMRHAKAKYNCTGETQLGGEVKKLLLQTLARISHPLQVKAALYVRLPIHWLGGCIQEFWIGKDSAALTKSYRDIHHFS